MAVGVAILAKTSMHLDMYFVLVLKISTFIQEQFSLNSTVEDYTPIERAFYSNDKNTILCNV